MIFLNSFLQPSEAPVVSELYSINDAASINNEADAIDLTRWKIVSGTPPLQVSGVGKADTTKFVGDYAIKITKNDGQNSIPYYEFTLEAGERYAIQMTMMFPFYASQGCRVWNGWVDAPNQFFSGETPNVWFTRNYEATTSQENVSIRWYLLADGAVLYIDNISITKIS